MRKFLIAGALAASLGLSACGATTTLDSAISSLGSSSNLQVHLTASASGPGSTQAQAVLNALSIDMNFSNPTGAALSTSKGQVDSEFTVNVGGQTLADIREVSGNAYLLVNLSAASSIPGVTLSSTQLAAIQLLFGGRWFEFPKSLIASYIAKHAPSAAQTAIDQAAGQKILDAITSVINATSYTTLASGGFSQTGSLESLLTAVAPTLQSLSGSTAPIAKVKGTYTVTVTTSGSSATGGSLSITAPNGTLGNETVDLQASVSHNSVAVSAPANPTIVSASLIKGLLSQATSSSGGLS